MIKKLLMVVSLCAAVLAAGCAVVVTPVNPTTVKGENDLTAMRVDVNGLTTDVDGIDLADVTIGDVSFASIDYGTSTVAKVTNRSGNVTVTIGEAIVSTTVLGQTVSVSFSNIDPMSTTITAETENTVVFDETTAGVIFSALAKKKAL